MDRPLVTHVRFILKKGLNNGAEIEWDKKSAGGCSNNSDTYKNNPLYQLTVSNTKIDNCLKVLDRY